MGEHGVHGMGEHGVLGMGEHGAPMIDGHGVHPMDGHGVPAPTCAVAYMGPCQMLARQELRLWSYLCEEGVR